MIKMQKPQKLKNTFTALVSPMDHDGDLHKEIYQQFIRWQISQGVGLVPCGTTGESPTLSHEEHEKVVEWCVQLAQESTEKPFVLAGSGSNSTKEAIRLSRNIEELGADGLLIITPYYNRPSQNGLIEHYGEIARAVSIPIVVYNVPSRTGCNILPETVSYLANRYDNIVGYKAASGNLEQIAELINTTPEDFIVMSGDDSLTLDIMQLGGKGVISVASNILPRRIQQFTEAISNGNWEYARAENQKLHDLFQKLFIETNPAPVKYAAEYLGLLDGNLRLPLVPLQPESKTILENVLDDLNISEGIIQ